MNDLYSKFLSHQNKAIVWKLLGNDGAFMNIPEAKAQQVKDTFDRKFEAISLQITPNDNLMNLDKRIITEMLDELNKYKAKSQEEMTLGYNAADIAQQRQKVFETELINKKKEFDTFNNTPVPEKIDFSDSLDTPIGSEMDKILAQQIALREKQLNMVLKTQDKEAATKWIQTPNDTKVVEAVKLKIGENIQLDVKEESKVKKVAFADVVARADTVAFADTEEKPFDNMNFMSLLKKKDTTPPDEVITLLREILAKQNQLLELLMPRQTN